MQNCFTQGTGAMDLYVPEVDYGFEEGVWESEQLGQTVGMSSDEALIISVNRSGMVDLPYMAEISGLSITRLISDLAGKAIFQNPAAFADEARWNPNDHWILRPQYLCGNIPVKLAETQKMEERFPGCFTRNVEALKKLLPATLGLEEIHVSLGASWIPPELYSRFIRELLRLPYLPGVIYQKELSRWMVVVKEFGRDTVLNKVTYGTEDMPALRIIEQTMNARNVKVYDHCEHHGKTESILNREKTLAAQEKQRLIIRKFEEWVFADEARRERLQECYNDAFVGYCATPYDGSFLELPGLNPDIQLYDHQKNAVARVLLSGENVLLAHDVGTGKTYEMIVSAHELSRMGLSRKNLIVVPNNVLGATVEAHRLLYPEDNILAVYPRDFTPKKRNAVLERMRDEEQVCVYMAYSSFNMVTMSKGYYVEKQFQELRELRAAAASASGSREKRALEAEAKRLHKKLSEYVVKGEQTPWLPFDELGIQTLFVDEIQNYKNIPIDCRADGIVGMHTAGSKKCKEMLEKCRNVDRLIFATGTPLTNSLSDLFALQTYLQPEELSFRGIDSFDMWINTFGERETNFEIDVDAGNLRVMTRFSSFHNLTELMSLFSTVCDFHQNDGSAEGMPTFRGYEDITVPKSPAQAAYIRNLSKRTERIRAKQVRRNEDNLLKVITDGRKAALDLRLISREELDEAGITFDAGTACATKVTACADKIVELYRRFPGTCQMVFSDLGTPKAGFNIYDSLRQELVLRKIPNSQIAYVHDATSESARAMLFSAINRGDIRVIIGSTEKLGVGVNVQERLVALHHLSVPWRPADMVQREGRILRQGNRCPEVFICRYITEGSFDAYIWQLLENKQRFISSFLSGTNGSRDQDDISDVVLSYAEIKALAIGNPLVKKRVETANRLDRVRMASRQRQKQLMELRAIVEGTPEKLIRLERTHRNISIDADYYRRTRASVSREERLAFGEELKEALADNALREKERIFDHYQGFQVMLPANMLPDKPCVLLRAASGTSYPVGMDGDKVLGYAMRLDRTLDDLTRRAEAVKAQMQEVQIQCQEAETDLESGNPHEETIEKLTALLAKIDQNLANTKEVA